jgi:hypothetical protein
MTEPVNFWRGNALKVARDDEMAEYAARWLAKRESPPVERQVAPPKTNPGTPMRSSDDGGSILNPIALAIGLSLWGM